MIRKLCKPITRNNITYEPGLKVIVVDCELNENYESGVCVTIAIVETQKILNVCPSYLTKFKK